MRKRKTSDAEGGICFSGAYNEQTDCGAGGKALKARVCESEKKRSRKGKTSDAEGGICFSGAYNEQTDCGAGGKALKARVCESEKKRSRKRKTSDAEGGKNIGAQLAGELTHKTDKRSVNYYRYYMRERTGRTN